MILFLFLAILFMPTPVTLNLNTGVISPEPTRRTLPVAMPKFTSVTYFSCRFSPHHLLALANFDWSLNNIHSDSFDDARIATLFTNVSITVVANDAIAKIQAAIIDSMLPESQADRISTAQIVSSFTLYANLGRPERRNKLRASSGLAAL